MTCLAVRWTSALWIQEVKVPLMASNRNDNAILVLEH